ncbi:kinase-like protein [Canariomyces notabilis]|uniref:Kinase-like protein n=1 Tax=Canariomyces notabilis TaxID=2074819 RepID=A0AAN6YUN3_9PEZI|nr:kinase-like protein [Canariomyces arenarius]
MILDVRAPRKGKGKQSYSATFPSVETVLQMHRQRTSGTRAQPLLPPGFSSPARWSLKWVARNFMVIDEFCWVYAVMPDGPEWREKEHIAEGGSSDVWKVTMSPSHQVHFQDHGTFALKVLKPGHEHAFRRELEVLKVFEQNNHPHIVRLLMAYEREGSYHLLFPCADGNLSSYWHSSDTERRSEDAQWMLRQCRGIAKGLQEIHSFGGEGKASICGRHGDIKPENILWFKDGPNDKFGSLVLSDFGLGRSRLYAPPESTHSEANSLTSHLSRQQYDIWSLGCVFLEFLTWFVGGWKELRDFYQERFKDGDRRCRNFASLRHRLLMIRSVLGDEGGLQCESTIGNGSLQLLREHCELVDRCLSLKPADRPTAREVAIILE